MNSSRKKFFYLRGATPKGVLREDSTRKKGDESQNLLLGHQGKGPLGAYEKAHRDGHKKGKKGVRRKGKRWTGKKDGPSIMFPHRPFLPRRRSKGKRVSISSRGIFFCTQLRGKGEKLVVTSNGRGVAWVVGK